MIARLTNDGSLVVLVRVEASTLLLGTSEFVVGVFDHIVLVDDLSLLESALVDIDLSVVLQIHYVVDYVLQLFLLINQINRLK